MSLSSALNVILVVIIAWTVYRTFAPVKGLKQLREQDFRKQYENAKQKRLIDVRETHEFSRGHIPGAISIPLSQLSRRLGELPVDHEIFLYCQSGMRSKKAAKLLLKNGIREVAHLSGGISAWSGERTR
ncbi:rhodanese-like domain-containing protein [Paenibacillus sediminis]|uniref:Rhodanese-related sulfurtransferase n=1 Tax=Paenibacillus sediminis TaxID=664909 RepID=A0ABS4H0E3_9BACL|nr:rhodanese-like domain-containing protein [Paenibacillus sediminis]MBP1935999.1 rhodanese-related sulfurtransferase [Paenibacillus sediminis]